MMLILSLLNVVIIEFIRMRKDDAISIMDNSTLNKKNWIIKKILLYTKNEWSNLLSKKLRSDVI